MYRTPYRRDSISRRWLTVRSNSTAVGAQLDTKANAWHASVLRRLGESLDEHATVLGDHPLRREIVDIRGDLDIPQSRLRACLSHQQTQRLRRITAAVLPRHDGISDVSEARRRQRLGAVLPAH